MGGSKFQSSAYALVFIEFFVPYTVIRTDLDNGDLSSFLMEKNLAVKLNECLFYYYYFLSGSGLLHMAVMLSKMEVKIMHLT